MIDPTNGLIDERFAGEGNAEETPWWIVAV
jgi:hypothetical protein